MEFFLIIFIFMGSVGVATSTIENKTQPKMLVGKQTRIIQETKETVYSSKIIKNWED